jgi:hypothetical protein
MQNRGPQGPRFFSLAFHLGTITRVARFVSREHVTGTCSTEGIPITTIVAAAPTTLGTESNASAVSWAAIAGGAIASAGFSLFLLKLGTGMGLSAISVLDGGRAAGRCPCGLLRGGRRRTQARRASSLREPQHLRHLQDAASFNRPAAFCVRALRAIQSSISLPAEAHTTAFQAANRPRLTSS